MAQVAAAVPARIEDLTAAAPRVEDLTAGSGALPATAYDLWAQHARRTDHILRELDEMRRQVRGCGCGCWPQRVPQGVGSTRGSTWGAVPG